MQINCTMEQKNLRSGNSFIWSSPCSFDWVFHSPLLAGGKGVTEYHEYCFISSIFRPLQQATAHLILACTRPWLCSWLQRTSHACCLLAGRLLQADSVCHLSESGAWRDRCLQSLSAHEPLPWRVLSFNLSLSTRSLLSHHNMQCCVQSTQSIFCSSTLVMGCLIDTSHIPRQCQVI
jgi:hypothetical protein